MTAIAPESIDLVRQALFPNKPEQAETPTVYAMAGIPGAGKSTYVEHARNSGLFPQNAFVLNPDIVMTRLPEYRQAKSCHGAEDAFAMYEMPARQLAYSLFDEAVDMGMDIIKDMACCREENFNILSDLKKRGYHLKMFYICVTPENALRRTSTRDRHTPEELVHQRHQALEQLIPRYRRLVDEFLALDNNDLDNPFKLMP